MKELYWAMEKEFYEKLNEIQGYFNEHIQELLEQKSQGSVNMEWLNTYFDNDYEEYCVFGNIFEIKYGTQNITEWLFENTYTDTEDFFESLRA